MYICKVVHMPGCVCGHQRSNYWIRFSPIMWVLKIKLNVSVLIESDSIH